MTSLDAGSNFSPPVNLHITPKSRPQFRKKPDNRDSLQYHNSPLSNPLPIQMAAGNANTASSSTGTKRHASSMGDESRTKRKRVDNTAASKAAEREKLMDVESSERESVMSLSDFQAFPASSLYKYLAHYEIVPPIHPSPLAADDPPPPVSLPTALSWSQNIQQQQPTASRGGQGSRAPSPPPAAPTNRGRRDPIAAAKESARRNSRFSQPPVGLPGYPPDGTVFSDFIPRTPILPDISDLHNVLASMVHTHHTMVAHDKNGKEVTMTGKEEVEVLANFMCAVRKASGQVGTRKYMY